MTPPAGTGRTALWARPLTYDRSPAARQRRSTTSGTGTVRRAHARVSAGRMGCADFRAPTAGAVLVGLAIADTLGLCLFAAVPEARGLALSAGVLLLAYAGRLGRLRITRARRPSPTVQSVVAEWGAVFIRRHVSLTCHKVRSGVRLHLCRGRRRSPADRPSQHRSESGIHRQEVAIEVDDPFHHRTICRFGRALPHRVWEEPQRVPKLLRQVRGCVPSTSARVTRGPPTCVGHLTRSQRFPGTHGTALRPCSPSGVWRRTTRTTPCW
jgi:hypothetical protein